MSIELERTQGKWTLHIEKRCIEITFVADELSVILECIRADEYRRLFNGERIITGKIEYP